MLSEKRISEMKTRLAQIELERVRLREEMAILHESVFLPKTETSNGMNFEKNRGSIIEALKIIEDDLELLNEEYNAIFLEFNEKYEEPGNFKKGFK